MMSTYQLNWGMSKHLTNLNHDPYVLGMIIQPLNIIEYFVFLIFSQPLNNIAEYDYRLRTVVSLLINPMVAKLFFFSIDQDC